MGEPTPYILTEFYIQCTQHVIFLPVLQKYKVIGYFRLVDDNLIIYNENIDNMLFEFNTVSSKLKFTLKLEVNGTELTF